MGAAESSEGNADEVDLSKVYGYRVMRVFRGSPAARSNLAPFEDFIVAVDGTMCDPEMNALGNLLMQNENKEVELLVWNCIDERERQVKMTPSKWSGPGLLGAAVKHEKLEHSTDCIWHVVELTPRSPADKAGLVPNTDYIVGTPAAVFKREEEMSTLIRDAARKHEVVNLCVFSSATGRLREVELEPSENWGGKGFLGCELATGWLHRIPPRFDNNEEPARPSNFSTTGFSGNRPTSRDSLQSGKKDGHELTRKSSRRSSRDSA
mmetsp:Transcript_3272/g.10014  ORF Transcript_3272/g.10014 Transcript_3272/m.10014 type:complete len:265 (+) Transcript_3272:88-882(+)